MSLISVIAPVFNEGRNVADLIAHLETLEGLEQVILVDASDNEQSKSVFKRLRKQVSPSFKLLVAEKAGRGVQMNLGVTQATGNILLFLHCDTRLPKEVASLIESKIASGYQWGRFDVALDARGGMFRLIEKMINLRSRVRHLATGDQGIFVSMSAFKQVGGYPEARLMEDIELSGRLKKHSSPALISTPVLTSSRRWQNRGVVKTILLMWKLRFLHWMGTSPEKLSKMYGDER